MGQQRQFSSTSPADNSADKRQLAVIIEDTISDANADSRSVSIILKHFEELSKTNPGSAISNELSLSVQELQGIDIFVQKLGHIRILHEMFTNEVVVEERAIICRLNHLQSVAARCDYEMIVSTLTQRIEMLLSLAPDNLKAVVAPLALFGRRDAIFNNLHQLSDIFFQDDREREGNDALQDVNHSKAIGKIRSTYSIDSERFVLDWLMSNVQGTEGEMLQSYHDRHLYAGMHCTDDIELF